MKHYYYCLIAGLPDIFIEDNKLSFGLRDFKDQLIEEKLPQEDLKLIQSFFWRYDNQNLLIRLTDSNNEPNTLANLSPEDLDELFAMAKDDSLENLKGRVPSYLGEFINAYKNETPLIPGKSWENQLAELYYQYIQILDNEFIRNWYDFEVGLTNILTAFNCRKHQMEIQGELIGDNELTANLAKSNARDFGISNEFPKLEAILRAVEEDNILEKEKKIDLLKWELLDDWTFFHYFTIEKIFAYILKMEMIERWLRLDKKTGEELFNRLLTNLESSYEFPEEFTIK